jgi:hypothetical protein
VATKKTRSSTGGNSTSGSSRKPSASASDSADRKTGMSDELIGQVAGEVWHLLSANGGQSLAAIKKSIDGPSELVMAGVGWLAREGKLEFASSGRSLKVSLR